MKSPLWLKAVLVVLAAAVLVLAGLYSWERVALSLLRKRLAEVEGGLAQITAQRRASSAETAVPADLQAGLDECRAGLARMERRQNTLLAHYRTATRDPGSTDEGLESALADRLGPQGVGAPHGPRRVTSMDELTAKLRLSAGQRRRVQEAIDQAKDSLFELASAQQDGDRSAMDDLMEKAEKGEIRGHMRDIARDLLSSNVPGTEETYYDRLLAIQRETQGALRGVLTPDQARELAGMKVNFMGVNTGYSPFRNWLRDQR